MDSPGQKHHRRPGATADRDREGLMIASPITYTEASQSCRGLRVAFGVCVPLCFWPENIAPR
jgi:hypothetical protein